MKLVNVMCFIAGVGSGFAIGYVVLNKKYENKLNQGLQDIREAYTSTKPEPVEKKETAEIPEKKQEAPQPEVKKEQTVVTNAGSLLEPEEPISYDRFCKEVPDEPVVSYKEPYEITYDEFATVGYQIRSLLYYPKQNIVTEYFEGQDPDEKKVNNPSALIGVDALCSFDNSEDDTIYVRNDDLKADFEIQISAKTYKPKKATPVKEG